MPLLSTKYVKQEFDGFPGTTIVPSDVANFSLSSIPFPLSGRIIVVASSCLKGRVEMTWKFEKRRISSTKIGRSGQNRHGWHRMSAYEESHW